MKEFIIGKVVVVRGLYSGTYAGEVVDCSDDFKVIHLRNAKQIRKIVTSDTSGGLAGILHGTPMEKPDIEKVAYCDGDIFLTENCEIMPLDEQAVEFVEKYAH